MKTTNVTNVFSPKILSDKMVKKYKLSTGIMSTDIPEWEPHAGDYVSYLGKKYKVVAKERYESEEESGTRIYLSKLNSRVSLEDTEPLEKNIFKRLIQKLRK